MKRLVFIWMLFGAFSANAQDIECFFDFDEVIHYRTSFTETQLNRVPQDSARTIYQFDSLAQVLLFTYRLPFHFGDSFSQKIYTETGYIANTVDTSIHKEIRTIFSGQNPPKEILETFCIPIFRDILIFKKDGMTTGAAKLCLQCTKYRFWGVTTNTGGFNVIDGFDRLETLLNKE